MKSRISRQFDRRRREGKVDADPLITVSEERGIRYLHFGTEWVQGAMRVRKPHDLELDYARHMMAWMLFREMPVRVVQLGCGVGALAGFMHHYLPGVEQLVVDNSAAVLNVARSQFMLPFDDDRLETVVADGAGFISDPAQRGTSGVLMVDVYDGDARGPVLDSEAFYRACAAALDPQGVFVVNLFGDVPTYGPNLARIRDAFQGRTLVLPPLEAGNVIVFGFAGERPALHRAVLHARARVVNEACGLHAAGWVNGFLAANDVR